MWQDYVAVIVGYAFSRLVGHWLISRLVPTLWRVLGWKRNTEAEYLFFRPELPAMVGVLERTLYTTSMLLKQPQFIGLWLALKVAGGWKGWSEPVKTPDGKIVLNGRDLFSVFLIGSGFSIAYGITGALIIQWLDKDNIVAAITVPAALVLGTVVYLLWARRHVR